jgi:hypothetical protein
MVRVRRTVRLKSATGLQVASSSFSFLLGGGLNDDLDTVRAKKYVRVKGLLYLVGIECHCKERQKAK